MKRRKLLQYVVGGTIASSMAGFVTSFASIADESENKVRWGYTGEEGPDVWGDLSSEYQACKLGVTQSPINLEEAIAAEVGELELNYEETALDVLNNGYTVQVNYSGDSSLTIDDQTYKLVQFHFHTPSEHHLQHEEFPMEVHLVHQNEEGNLAVVGVFMQEGEYNSVLAPIWKVMPQRPSEVKQDTKINVRNLLPSDLSYYTYYGSLTTPPCSEGVRWIVLQQPIEVSADQIRRFSQTIAYNARPIQPRRDSFLLQSGD